MSVEALAIVLHHSRARGTARLVLLGIANHDGDGGAWPSVATLSKYAACSERQVQRAIGQLVALGEVDRAVQQGGTQDTPDAMRPNRYTLTVCCPVDCDRTAAHRTARQLRLERGPGRPRNRVTSVSPGDLGVTGGGDLGVTGGVTWVSPEPSLEPSGETGVDFQPQPQRGTTPVDNHRCDRGWLLDAEGDAVPCLVCKPHLARSLTRAGAR